MLQIKHQKTPVISVDLDTTGFTADVIANSNLAYVQGLVAGKAVNVDTSGKVQLHDGTADLTNSTFIGLLVNDAAGESYGNRPSLADASYQIGVVMRGGARVVSDQIASGLTVTPGEPIYVDANGLLTDVQATTEAPIGLSMSAASDASPELDLLLF